jgi:hypothetical protein
MPGARKSKQERIQIVLISVLLRISAYEVWVILPLGKEGLALAFRRREGHGRG